VIPNSLQGRELFIFAYMLTYCCYWSYACQFCAVWVRF